MSRSATSCGPRIVQRAEGQSASSRRPSSKAATSWAALASPTPLDRRQLELRGARETGQAIVPGERVGREVDGRPTTRAGSPDQPDELGRRQATDATQREPFARPFGDAAARGSPDRRGAGDGSSPRSLDPGHRGTSVDEMRRSGVPGPERREPANSPRRPDLEDVAEPTDGPSPGTQSRVHRGSSAAGGRGWSRRSGARDGRPRYCGGAHA